MGFSLAIACPALAEKVVASGGRVKLDMIGAFDQACHSLGPMTVNITQAPLGGSVFTQRSLDYPNFPSLNTRSRCNTSKLPETNLIYQASPGFVGNDTIIVEWIAPNGSLFRRLYRISVRPGSTQVPDLSDAPVQPRPHRRTVHAATRHTQATNHPAIRRPQAPVHIGGKIET